MPDRCSVLFYPRGQSEPILAGELRLLPGMKGSVFQYARSYLYNRLAIALDPIALPLHGGEIVTLRSDNSLIPDVFSDAGPDAWGRLVIDRVSNLERKSEFDYLLAAGSNRAGALDFCIDGQTRKPAAMQMSELADIEMAIDRIRMKLPIEESHRLLLAPGTSVGGMRPKTLVELDGSLWIAKFNARDEDLDAVSMEYAGMTLAKQCGLHVAPVYKHQLKDIFEGAHADKRIVLLVRRFDRAPLGNGHYGRIPYISARTLLRGYAKETEGAVPSEYSYVVLADALRRVAVADTLSTDLRELFRRMVFNILIDNTDDHERNHGLLFEQGWRLAPGFDISSQTTGLGYQAMCVAAQSTDSSLINARSECGRFGLRQEEAKNLVDELIASTESLETFYVNAGVETEQTAHVAQTRQRIVSAYAKTGFLPR